MTTTRRNRLSIREAYEASRCRRRRDRQKLTPSAITCWSPEQSPTSVTSIEIDSRGARLLLPWDSEPGECIQVSLADEMGNHRTTVARVVWTRPLENSSRVIAGLAFQEEMTIAA